MPNLSNRTADTTEELSLLTIANCRGLQTPLDPYNLPLDTNTEWISNYRELIIRFRNLRRTCSNQDFRLYKICLDRIAAMVSYLEKREPLSLWPETRPYMRYSFREDAKMGKEAKLRLFEDAQNLWTLDALLQEEEISLIIRGRRMNSARVVLRQWESMGFFSSLRQLGSENSGLNLIPETIVNTLGASSQSTGDAPHFDHERHSTNPDRNVPEESIDGSIRYEINMSLDVYDAKYTLVLC